MIPVVQATSIQAPPHVTDPDGTALAEDLQALFCFLHRASGQRWFAVAEELDLSISQVKVLHRLDAAPTDTSVKELGEGLGLSLPAASRTVEALLGRGLLGRREDEHDRRVRRVTITEVGRETVLRLNRARLADLETFVASLSSSERRLMAGALRTLLAREEIAACRPAPRPSPAVKEPPCR
jgi:DNA-binding MarR family transcriptional regulator